MNMFNMFFRPHDFRGFPMGQPGDDLRAFPVDKAGYTQQWTRYICPNYATVGMVASDDDKRLDANQVYYPARTATIADQDHGGGYVANAFYGHVLPERFSTYPIFLPNTLEVSNTSQYAWRGTYSVEAVNDENIANPNICYWPVTESGWSENPHQNGVIATTPTPGHNILIGERIALLPPSNIRYVKRSTETPTVYEYALCSWQGNDELEMYPTRYLWKISILKRPFGSSAWDMSTVGHPIGTSTAMPKALRDVFYRLPMEHAVYGESTGDYATDEITDCLETFYYQSKRCQIVAETLVNSISDCVQDYAIYLCSGSNSFQDSGTILNTHPHQHHTEWDETRGVTTCGSGFVGLNAASYCFRANLTVGVSVKFVSTTTTLQLSATRSGVCGVSQVGPIAPDFAGQTGAFFGRIPDDVNGKIGVNPSFATTSDNVFSFDNPCLYDWEGLRGAVPVANDDDVETEVNTPVTIPVLSNDTDADGDTLTITAVTTPTHGLADIAVDGKSIVYTPRMNYVGKDEFTYTVSDGTNTDTATVYVSVLQP